MRYAPNDSDILKRLADYVYLQAHHLSELTGRSVYVCRRRFRALRELGFVKRLPLPFETSEVINAGEHVHFLSEKGAEYLERYLGVEAHAPARETNTWLRHDVDITEFHLTLHWTGKLVFWQQFGISSAGVNPDAFFGMDGPEGVSYFFLENERGRAKVVEREDTLITKFRHYLDYSKGPFQKAWDIPNFRVVTILPSEERMRNILAKMEDGLRNRKFWFTTAEDASSLGFRTPKDDGHVTFP